MIPELEAAQGTKCIVHNPFYQREGTLNVLDGRARLLYYANGKPTQVVFYADDLQPIPLAEQVHTSTIHQFRVGYEPGHVITSGLVGLLDRLLLALVGVRGPNSYWKLRSPEMAAIYDRESGKRTLEFDHY